MEAQFQVLLLLYKLEINFQFDSIVLNDIAHRAGVKDTHILKSVILFLADNVGQLVNPSKISNTLTSERVPTSNHTISKYLDFTSRL
jgi:uncharacterized protein HI_1038